MNEEKKFEIAKVSEFLKIIEDNNFKDCYSRGESQDYGDGRLTASAVRNNGKHLNKGIDEFYNSIGNEITNMQHQHFLAYAQHYKLPTQLLDFTESPLVSLFFACCDNNETKCFHCKLKRCDDCKKKNNETGCVYFINKTRCIDISDEISKQYVTKDLLYNLLDRLISSTDRMKLLITSDGRTYEDIYNLKSIINIFDKKNDEFYKNLNILFNDKEMHINTGFIFKFKERIINELLTKLLSLQYYIDEKKSEEIKSYLNGCGLSEFFHIFVVIVLFYSTSIKIETISKKFNVPFYYIYNPPEICDRISSQHSVFIYQLAWDCGYSLSQDYGYRREIAYQNIRPNYIIKIIGEKTKKDILRNLDRLGINMKSIMGGHEGIAEYIKWKNENP